MRAPTVKLDDVTVRLGGRTALDSLTGEFAPGTVTALIGGDGAGKSTLIRLLAGRLVADGGRCLGLPERPRDVGYQPADSGAWLNLSVAENLEFVAGVYRLPEDAWRPRAADLLSRAGLAEVSDRPAGRLSGGMRQKLGVVLATLHSPGLVLLDEPTTGVDPISRAELWGMIAGAAADGATVVFATTYLDEAERANSLFLLGGGRLLAAGTPDDVIGHAPGSIWESPASSADARRELHAPVAWRRADKVYRWTPATHGDAPAGFLRSPGDLENASIALLLASGGADGAWPGRSDSVADRDTRRNDALVEARDVGRTFGTFTALQGVSLSVRPGEVVGLLGGNGAGKTTLMRILLGLDSATTGSPRLFDSKPSLESRRRIGYVAQGLGLYPALSAMENLQFSASVYGVRVGPQATAYAQSLGRSPVGCLPLGARRILAYLAATAHDPDLLVLDEPTSAMDALTRARLWRDLRSSADRGVGVLVTTHYMQEAAQCDRLVLLTSGRVSAMGSADQITSPYSSVTVTTANWRAAFTLLRDAGIPALLDGRTLRAPGANPAQIESLLAPLADPARIRTAAATLEETMVLAARDPVP